MKLCTHQDCINFETAITLRCIECNGDSKYEPKPDRGFDEGAQKNVLDDSSGESVSINLDQTSGTEIFWLIDFKNNDTTMQDIHECKYCRSKIFYVKRSNSEMTCQKCNEKHEKIMSLNN